MYAQVGQILNTVQVPYRLMSILNILSSAYRGRGKLRGSDLSRFGLEACVQYKIETDKATDT
jgi:hypothetical protein